MSYSNQQAKLTVVSILLVLILSITALWFNYRFPRNAPWTITHIGQIKLQYSPPPLNEVTKIDSFPHYFTLNVPTTTFRLQFFFRCQTTCQQLWLTLPATNQIPLELLIYHHQLQQAPYFKLQNSWYTLYQKQPQYVSFQELLATLPSSFATDNYLARTLFPRYSIPSIIGSDDPLPDFILTTFSTPRLFGDYLEFNRIIDTSNLTIPNRQLTFTLNAYPQNQTVFTTTPAIVSLDPYSIETPK